MVQFYITPYENGYCFVHDSGRPDKFIFSTEKAVGISFGKDKLYRIDVSYFEIVKEDGSVERIPYMCIPKENIIGTLYRSEGIVKEDKVLIPSH
jgi:hypothetical protein